MDSKEILALIDSMELNEDFINNLLRKIMMRNSFTKKHIENALRFLKYKLAVNKQETLFCKNEREYEFVVNLFKDIKPENIELLCEITNIVLQLDPRTIISKAEHLLQQIFSQIELPCFQLEPTVTDDDTSKTLLDLKVCSSILEAVISLKKKVPLPFLDVPLETMVFSPNEKVLSFFYTSTIQNFYNGVSGFAILDRLWILLKLSKEYKSVALKAISCLADYYLPVEDAQKQSNIESIAPDLEFWEIVLFGLQSPDNTVRKRAIYLIKRALESLTGSQKDININTEDMVMVWDKKNEKILKTMWDNFFILIESLEEVQSNIVLPSLKLFESVKHLGHCWLNCAYNIGLQHDNASVRLHCILYRLEIKVESISEALTLLNALNDVNLYESPLDGKELTTNISKALEDKQCFMNILEAVPNVKWSPVPLYYLSESLAEVVYPSLLLNVEHKKICMIINDILRIPCNSPVIKKALYVNVCNLIVNTCKGFVWEDYVNIYPQLHVETPINTYVMSPLATHIKKNMYLSDTDKNGFADAMCNFCENIYIALIYVNAHEQDGILFFLNVIDEKIEKIIDICNRPFANKSMCLIDVNFLIKVYSITAGRSEPYMVFINSAIMKHFKVILQYIGSLLTCTAPVDAEGVISLYETLKSMPINEVSAKEILFEIYQTSVALLNDTESPMYKKTSAVCIMNYLSTNNVLNEYHKNEMLSLEQFLVTINTIGKDMNVQGSGKLKNAFYEKTCEILLSYLKEEPNDKDVMEIYGFIEDVLDCGGYGCLKFVLQIINNILPKLIDSEMPRYDLCIPLAQIWGQICELKTNKEYVVCVDDYLKLITQDQLLRHPQYNAVVVNQYSTIIDLAVTKRMPLFYLVKHLSSRNVLAYDNMVHILCNILLYAIVPKKDQRITENLAVELLSKMEGVMTTKLLWSKLRYTNMQIFSQHIQFLSIIMLSKVTNANKLNDLSERIMYEIDQILKAKPRYYTNNTTHRKLFRALQALLFIFLKTRQVDVRKTATWCMNLLRIPHDVSVKICIFWYIALYIYSTDIAIDSHLLNHLSQNGVPVICQFSIVYYVMRHKITAHLHYVPETEYVLDFLLSHTMGPVFNVRLSAQYYAMMLLETGTIRKMISADKYDSIIAILSKTLGDLVTSKDNTFANFRTDYFTQTFNIVGDLTPMFIFHSLQRRCEQCNENIDTHFAIRVFTEIEELLPTEEHDTFYVEWKSSYRWHAFLHYQGLPSSSHMDVQDENNTIQKKYVPWKNMIELDTEKFRRNPRTATELIVVASLVNRAPNLGGLARTCEVFGVMNYVIDNLRYVNDKQFQSLSVSADRWVNIQEVHAGRALKEFLHRKKKEGYCIIAAEQTSNSRNLADFNFPKKSLIVLGNEKEGIPPNLLPMMDFCVEIPQHGIIRSLNVHVTASIFIWEYTRQHAIRSAPPFLK